jgi:4-amino-4-deoxy-L-arabinose transferase-like glycosyltransferase
MTTEKYSLAWLLIFLTAITAYRALILANYDLTLYIDEAYYWVWAQHLDWGYYSKPPVIAVLISAATSVCGDSETCIRSIGIIFYPLTALGIYATGRELAGGRVGLWAALLFITMPAISLSSFVASTDVPLLLCWSWALYLFIKALHNNSWAWWILLGLVGGIGMLSKYNFAIFFISGLLLMLMAKQYRHNLLSIRPWVTVLIAFLLFLPNLVWNINNDFPTITHTTEISGVTDKMLFHWDELTGFLVSQFVVMGVISFACYIAVLTRSNWWRNGDRLSMLMMSLPFLLIISSVALFGRANENWASPTYIAGVLLIAWWLHEKRANQVMFVAIATNLVLMIGLAHFDSIKTLAGIEHSDNNDPFKRLRGWQEFTAQVESRISDPSVIVVSPSRSLLSHYLYESKQPIEKVASWNPKNTVRHHFDLVTELQPGSQQTYLILDVNNTACLQQSFEHLQADEPIVVSIHKDYEIRASVIHASGFKGYQCQ